VVIEGEADLQIGDQQQILKAVAMACVPRWVVHQTRNASADQPLVMLAITDVGLTSEVLGDYDSRTRFDHNGEDAA
jgi:mannose-6-phosphate isomerase-like protein (cupin superfamily)